jgi:hypothetical protein
MSLYSRPYNGWYGCVIRKVSRVPAVLTAVDCVLQREEGASLSALVRDRVGLTSHHPGWMRPRPTLPEPSKLTAHQGRRGVLVAEIRSPCRQWPRPTATSPRDAAHAPPQLRSCPSPGGRRCLGDSRLPWSRIYQHNQPLHHDEPANEASGPRRILEAGRPRSEGSSKVAAVAEAARLSPNPMTLSGVPVALEPCPVALRGTSQRSLRITPESG